MKKINLIMFFILFTITPRVLAETVNIDETVAKCASENYMTVDMNKCIQDGINAWNDEINNYSTKIKNNLSDKNIKLYENSQDAWLNYYNKEKLFILESISERSGDIHTTFAIQNLYELTKQRAITLKNYFYELTE